MMNKLLDFCSDIGIDYLKNAPISEYLTFKVGGPCRAMLFPDTVDKLVEALKYIRDNDIKHYVIGRGSNLIAPDSGYDGVIINTCNLDGISVNDNFVDCLAGTPLLKLCRFALDNYLSGLESLYGIPGTVGGAVYMNAGAYGGEIKDTVVSATYIDNNCKPVTLPADSLDLSYRHSYFADKDFIIVSASFKLYKSDKAIIKEKMDTLMGKRRDKQPLEYPSAGSTFKRPVGYYAGALIEENGLKGYTVGGAQVSEKHAGFVINKGGATCDDILRVIEHCRDTVYKATGITLETEVKMIL